MPSASPCRWRRSGCAGLSHPPPVAGMEKAGLIALERLVRFRRGFGPQGIEIAYPMAAQAAIRARARHMRVEKLTANGQQIAQREQQHPAQLDRHGFLRRGQRRRQLMSGVRAALKAGPPPPAPDGVRRHPVASRTGGCRLIAGRNLRPDRRRRRRILVQRSHHRAAPPVAHISSPAIRPRYEEWQTAVVNADARDGAVIHFGLRLARIL